MPKNMVSLCGQYVYSQRTTQGTTCVGSSTVVYTSPTRATFPGYNSQLIHTSMRSLSHELSTRNFMLLTSVISQFIHGIHNTYNYSHEFKKGISI